MIWWFAGAMLVVAMVAILLPLLRKSPSSMLTLDSNTANVALLKDQLEELEADYRNGNLTQEELEQARNDLETSVAADLQDESAHAQQMSLKHRTILSLILVVAVPLGSVAMYLQVSTYQEMPSRAETVQQVMEQAAGEKLPPIDEMVEALAARLREDPENIEGWSMLGRTYVILQRFDDAANAYARAYDLAGDTNAGLITDYAEALAQTNGGSMQGRPEQLIQKALEIDSGLPKALWLAGFGAAERGDYESAIDTWSTLLENDQIDMESRQMLEDYVAEARVQSGAAAAPAASSDSIEAVDVDLSGATTALPAAIRVQVDLDASLKAQTRPEEAVFVFARATSGMPAPLAVQKLTVADLPVEVLLDDSMAMMPGHNLSSKEQVIVGARVSRSGSPMSQPGDLQGLSGALATSDVGQVSIIINQVVE